MKHTMKSSSLALVILYYVALVASELIEDESHFIRVVSVKQVHTDKIDSPRTGTNGNIAGRQMQTEPTVTCSSTPHGQAIQCVEQTPSNDIIKYSVSCPAGVTVVDDCLTDQKRICYQFNSQPCIGGFYCEKTNRFSLDCGNLFARSNNNTCSKTDCDLNCAQIRDVPVDYNSVELDNDCFRLGLSSITNGDVVTTEWTQILSDTTEIQVTGTRSSAASVFNTCQVSVRDQAGSSCPCNVNCSPQVNAISYDCTDFSSDSCAAIDCNGNCLIGGFPSVTTPVAVAPVSPPVTTPVVVAPLSPPVTTPVVVAPLSPPVTTPVVVAPVSPPVTAPVALAPVSSPVTSPVVIAPVTPPIIAPNTPPLLPPVGIITSPPVTRPVPVPTSNATTTCPLWWGLY